MEERHDEIVIYQSEDGLIKVDVLFENETVWLTQQQMAVLFGKATSTINEHIKNIYEEGELQEEATTHKFGISEFMRKAPIYYNLDVIISVGYRVKSHQGTQFRIWATQRLRDYIIKGVALNDERFKRGNSMNYFRDLLDRIREIRLSERVFYQQIKDIYKTSIDYDPSDEITLKFFKEVQNKLLWAVSGKTAAELVYYRANAELPPFTISAKRAHHSAISNNMENRKDQIYKEKFMAFAIRMVKLKNYLNEQKHEYNIADQIQRSGTAIGANHREATFAESDSDFIHKLQIAQKECGETIYWLELLKATEYISEEQFNSLYADAEEIMRMLTSSIMTTRKRLKK